MNVPDALPLGNVATCNVVVVSRLNKNDGGSTIINVPENDTRVKYMAFDSPVNVTIPPSDRIKLEMLQMRLLLSESVALSPIISVPR